MHAINVNIERATDTSLSELERFGTFGFESNTYLNLLFFYSRMPPTIEKKIVYYEDLMKDDKAFLDIADFLNISYDKQIRSVIYITRFIV